jgi:MFS family permease
MRVPSDTSEIALERYAATPAAGLGAAIWSQLFLRVASTAGLLVIGSYLVALHDRWGDVTPLVVGAVTIIAALVEFTVAPLSGALSDRGGRKRFLLAGPALSMVAVLLPPLGGLGRALPPLGLALTLITCTRVVEGIGGAFSAPATLGLLAEGTDAQPVRRGRQMSFYELASSGGIALGAALGPLLWARLHVSAFLVLSVLYLLATIAVLFVREGPRERPFARSALDLQSYKRIFADTRLRLFSIAWIAVAAILGVWISAQLTYLLSARLSVPHQHFVGSLHRHTATLSTILGAYLIWFTLCVLAWSGIVGRLPRLPVLLVASCGAIVACAGFVALNHGARPALVVPAIMLGVLLEAGFAPAALTYLADISQAFAENRGLLMGLYSVILGIGQFLGNGLGAIFAQFLAFDGLALLTILLAAITLAALATLLVHERQCQ